MKNKNILYVLFLLLFAGFTFSCSKDDDNGLEVDVEWKKRNEEVFQKIIDSREYIPYTATNNAGSIYVKVLKEGEGKEAIFQNDSVWIYYDLYLGDEVEPFLSIQDPNNIAKRVWVKENNSFDITSGLFNALLRMKEGDKWEIWVPQQLGFGKSGYTYSSNSYILPYTTLKYIVEVKRIRHFPF